MFVPRVHVDLDDLRARAGRMQAILIQSIEDVADEGARVAVQHARSTHSFTDRTGALRGSIMVTETARATARRALATIAAKAPHAAYVEWGTGQHWIRPRMARSFIGPTQEGQRREKRAPRGRGNRVPGMLVFYSPRLGRWVRTLEVWHPGTSARLYMHDGARAALDAMTRSVRNDVARRLQAIWMH
jgi:hypothetical protein